jgi:hypothetical protein
MFHCFFSQLAAKGTGSEESLQKVVSMIADVDARQTAMITVMKEFEVRILKMLGDLFGVDGNDFKGGEQPVELLKEQGKEKERAMEKEDEAVFTSLQNNSIDSNGKVSFTLLFLVFLQPTFIFFRNKLPHSCLPFKI